MRFPRRKRPEAPEPEGQAKISEVGYSYQIRFDPLDEIFPYRVVMYLDGKEMAPRYRGTSFAYAQSEKDAHEYGRKLVAQCNKFNSHDTRIL